MSSKNSLKKLISMAGVASASALFSFPAFALTNSDASISRQTFNQHNDRTDSTGQLVAQNTPKNSDYQPSSRSDSNRANEGSTTDSSKKAHDMSRPADSNGSGMRALTGGDSVKGINWICLNNPNPSCGG